MSILTLSVKMMEYTFVIIIFGLCILLFAKGFDKLYGTFNEKKERSKSKFQSIAEMIGMLWFSGIIIYIFKNILINFQPSFDGIYGFDKTKVKDLENMFVYTFILISTYILFFSKNR
jgi:hypothetical protein